MQVAGFARGPLSSGTSLDQVQLVDLRERAAVARAVAAIQPDFVFHLAGRTTGSPSDLYEANTLGTVHVLDALREHAPRARILLVGSAAEYGPAAPLPVVEASVCEPRG